jgi:hypothetical protein
MKAAIECVNTQVWLHLQRHLAGDFRRASGDAPLPLPKRVAFEEEKLATANSAMMGHIWSKVDID